MLPPRVTKFFIRRSRKNFAPVTDGPPLGSGHRTKLATHPLSDVKTNFQYILKV